MPLLTKMYQFTPSQVIDTTATGMNLLLAAALATDGVNELNIKTVDMEVIRGEIIVLVTHAP